MTKVEAITVQEYIVVLIGIGRISSYGSNIFILRKNYLQLCNINIFLLITTSFIFMLFSTNVTKQIICLLGTKIIISRKEKICGKVIEKDKRGN